MVFSSSLIFLLYRNLENKFENDRKQLREGLIQDKKNVNFHTFGPDPPPPLKSVKLNKIFFSLTLTETYFGKRNLFFHLQT